MASYWDRILAQRTTRRRALSVTATAAAGATLLAACGGDDDDGSQDSSGLLTSVKEDKTVKRGGTHKWFQFFEPRNWDPHVFPNNFMSQDTFSVLFSVRYGVGEETTGEVEQNLAESWEYSPDKTTLTIKLSSGAQFAPVAPVNGRAVDAQDVVASWERYKGVSNNRADYDNSVNPAAPITSITAPDSRTVVIKTSGPFASLPWLLARESPGSFFIIPKEALDEKVLNITRNPIGSGYFYVDNYQPSIGWTLRRNPGFKHIKGELPYLDAIEEPLITETATGVAQFRAGNLYTYAIPQEEIVPTKRQIPELELTAGELQTSTLRMAFGTAPDSIFKDQRVRQAWMLTIDRQALLDVLFNLSGFSKEGIQVESALECGLQSPTYKGWFLNPATDAKAFGDNAKFFSKNLEEAKKLLSAAGQPIGVETPVAWVQKSAAWSQAAWYQGVDIVMGMVQESGVFRPKQNIIQNFYPDYVEPYHHQTVEKNYVGAAFSISGNFPVDPAVLLFQYYNSRGSLRQSTDTKLEDLTSRVVREFDETKRRELAREIQVYEAGANFFPRMGGARGLTLNWPALRNWGVYWGGTQLRYARVFIDPTKAPLKS